MTETCGFFSCGSAQPNQLMRFLGSPLQTINRWRCVYRPPNKPKLIKRRQWSVLFPREFFLQSFHDRFFGAHVTDQYNRACLAPSQRNSLSMSALQLLHAALSQCGCSLLLASMLQLLATTVTEHHNTLSGTRITVFWAWQYNKNIDLHTLFAS